MKIKEETNKLIDRCYTKGGRDLMVFQRQKFLNELFPLLDRLGVVVRVGRELPYYPGDAAYDKLLKSDIYLNSQDDMLKAGCGFFEPLICCSTCKKEPCTCPGIDRGSFAKYVEEDE